MAGCIVESISLPSPYLSPAIRKGAVLARVPQFVVTPMLSPLTAGTFWATRLLVAPGNVAASTPTSPSPLRSARNW